MDQEVKPRKLATLERIAGIYPIVGADRIVQYGVKGWKVVDQIGKYAIGDPVIYIEVDAWVPTTIAPFLSKGKEPRQFNGTPGEKLRTIKLKGALSQGLLLAADADHAYAFNEGDDLTDVLGIQKWEAPTSANGHVSIRGSFPGFITKTDQERVQNCFGELPAGLWHVTEKLEGQSFTAYIRDGEFGICSRNIELKMDEPSTWLATAHRYGLPEKMAALDRNIAIQGEQCGPGIQGNIYGFPDVRLFVFGAFDIDTGSALAPRDALALASTLGLPFVPIKQEAFPLAGCDCDTIVAMADGWSQMNPEVKREGLVFRHEGGQCSFKAVSNAYLLGLKD